MKNAIPLPLPRNPRHQHFAELVLQGRNQSDAYVEACVIGDKELTRESIWNGACRLMHRPDVAAYIDAVRKQSATGAVLTLTEKREFLARVIRTPITTIDPHDPRDPNRDLVRKVKRRFLAKKEGDERVEYIVEDMEKLDPLKAIELDNKLSGNDPETNTMKQLSEILAGIAAGTTLPGERME